MGISSQPGEEAIELTPRTSDPQGFPASQVSQGGQGWASTLPRLDE
jgi:hypothetical protein